MLFHYFVYSFRLVFSCSIEIMFIRQHHDGRSFVQCGCIVLHYSGVSEYHVAVAMVRALDVM
jgi:hypothetical protein